MNNKSDYKICNMCGSLIDNNNIVNINQKEICKSCIEKSLEQKQNFNFLNTFLFSLFPGIGQIYLGKKEKGIFLSISFMLNIFLLIISYLYIDELIIFNLTFAISSVLSCTIYIYSLFDANISKKFIENNKYIDGFVDKLIYKIFRKNNNKFLEQKIIDKRLQ